MKYLITRFLLREPFVTIMILCNEICFFVLSPEFFGCMLLLFILVFGLSFILSYKAIKTCLKVILWYITTTVIIIPCTFFLESPMKWYYWDVIENGSAIAYGHFLFPFINTFWSIVLALVIRYILIGKILNDMCFKIKSRFNCNVGLENIFIQKM
jgi:hypothetical protein